MTTPSDRRASVPTLSSPRNLASLARFGAFVTGVLGCLGAVLSVTYTEQTEFERVRPFVGLGVGVLGATVGLVVLLLVMAGLADHTARSTTAS